jgi:hypothetical protein
VANATSSEHLHKKVFLLSQQLVDAKGELKTTRDTRAKEMAAVARMVRQLNDRIVQLEGRTRDVVSSYNEKCEENRQVCCAMDS